MSWQPVSYWTIRCDGRIPHGQCQQRLYPDPDAMVVAHAWDRYGDVESVPILFSGGSQQELSEQWMHKHGWLKTDARMLCPDHVAALERDAEAEINGLPFDEEVNQ